jgi:hypothetical protein
MPNKKAAFQRLFFFMRKITSWRQQLEQLEQQERQEQQQGLQRQVRLVLGQQQERLQQALLLLSYRKRPRRLLT